jgi:hypothetical protein
MTESNDKNRLAPNGLRHGQCAGVDSAWEQEKLEATLREMLAVGAAEFPAACPELVEGSSPRFVGCFKYTFLLSFYRGNIHL